MKRALILVVVASALSLVRPSSALAQVEAAGVDSISLSGVEIDRPDFAVYANEQMALVSGPGQYLALVNIRSGVARPLSRTGAGPGEYRSIGALFACADAAGWVDRTLRRVVWVSPDDGRYLKQLALPPNVASTGTPVAAVCRDGSLWIAMEARTRARGSEIVSDTVRVFRLAPDAVTFDEVATLRGSTRRLGSKGTIFLSLRIPWTAHPELVPLDANRLALVSRRSNSMTIRSAQGQPLATVRLPSGLSLATKARALVRDSLRQTLEDEMVAVRYDVALQRDARAVHAALRGEMEWPSRMPFVLRAWRDVGGGERIGVLENGAPGTPEACVSLISLQGERTARRCFRWSDRTTHTVLSSDTHLLWLQSNEDGEAWLLRTARPN